jgi:hypothetical protein
MIPGFSWCRASAGGPDRDGHHHPECNTPILSIVIISLNNRLVRVANMFHMIFSTKMNFLKRGKSPDKLSVFGSKF